MLVNCNLYELLICMFLLRSNICFENDDFRQMQDSVMVVLPCQHKSATRHSTICSIYEKHMSVIKTLEIMFIYTFAEEK